MNVVLMMLETTVTLRKARMRENGEQPRGGIHVLQWPRSLLGAA